MNRPEARNGIDPAMRGELTEVLTDADADPLVRALVITGQGRDFCTGADLQPEGDDRAAHRPPSPLDYRRAVAPWQRLFATLWELETPVVSAVNGTTAGSGWMLALLADLVVAAEGARWTHAFARRGMVPHAGDPFFLPRVLPFHRLNEAALLGDTLTSETLHAWGAVNRLVPADKLEATARDLAERLAAGPTKSLGT
ncbi:MAG: enoyl-CoA hydratase/isomerase family protein, partial [Acidimicrobiia bacterium]